MSESTVLALLLAQNCPVNPGRALVRAGLKRQQADRLLATPVAGAAELARVDELGRLLATQSIGELAGHAAATQALALDLLADPERVRVTVLGPPWLGPGPWLPSDGIVSPAAARRVHHQLHGRWVAGRRVEVRCDPPLRIGRRPSSRESQATRRRRLFSRWNEGIRWDDQGLYSATDEALALELAAGAEGLAFDAGCGLGCLSIALARTPGVTRVIAVEQDRERLAHARHNAALYGVEERIEFRHGDVVAELQQSPCDVLVADPPWGGRSYDREQLPVADLGYDLLALLAHAPGDVRLKLPPSVLAEGLPGAWSWRPGVDARGNLKFLVATRA